jgi:hypothetical protein
MVIMVVALMVMAARTTVSSSARYLKQGARSPPPGFCLELAESWDMANVRLIKHEAVPKCGSFEVRFADGRPSRYFYWDDIAGRRLRDQVDSQKALERAKAFARAERDR